MNPPPINPPGPPPPLPPPLPARRVLDYSTPPSLPPRRASAGVLDYFPDLPQGELRSLRWRSFAPIALLAGTLAALVAGEVESSAGLASPLLTGGLFAAFVCWVISAATFLELCRVFVGRPKPTWALLALWANAPSVVAPPAAMVLATLAALPW